MTEVKQDELVEYECIACKCKTAGYRNETRYLERMCYRCWCAAQGVILE